MVLGPTATPGRTDGISTDSNSNNGFAVLASAPLPTLGGDSLQKPSWQRSIQELGAANMKFSSYSAAHVLPSAEAQLLLGNKTDFGLLSNTASTSDRGKSYGGGDTFSFDTMSGGGIQEVVERHRDGILQRILKDQREQTRRLLDEKVEHHLQQTWAKEREWWKKNLVANRNLIDSTNTPGSGSSPFGTEGGVVGVGKSGGLLLGDFSSNFTSSIYATKSDPKEIQDHLIVVQSIGPSSDYGHLIRKFEKVALAGENSTMYQTAWQLLGSVLPSMQTPVFAALGVEFHFCRQYQHYISSQVKSASLNGQDVSTTVQYSNGMAGKIASFVKLVSGSNASVWEVLYYCLRCGDANAAKAVLDTTPAGNQELATEQPILTHVINELSRQQGNASCMFENGAVPMVDPQGCASILNLYERARNLDPNNKHRINVLALLCGQYLESALTIEDYLFGLFWHALQDRDDPISQIAAIGAKIKDFGPSQFADEEKKAWGYAFPLIASLQFKTALSFLAENGGSVGLMQSTHLALVFSVAGVDVSDMVDDPDNKPAGGDLTTILLTKYAQLLEREPSAGVLAALQYLLKIPSTEDSFDKIASFICRSPQYSVLTGELDPTFERVNSELDKHLSRKDVSIILTKSASMLQNIAVNDSNTGKVCANLLMLASSHTKLVQLLCGLISPPNVTNDDKVFWAKESEFFYESHLSKRTIVLESLERDRKQDLVSTIRILLELRQFFDLHRYGKSEEAFNFLTGVRLLPLRQEEVNERQSIFRDLDPIVKQVFPDMIVASVECLFHMYQRIKSECRVVTPEAEARLRELGHFARLIFTFAGLINMPSTCKNSVAQIRASMV